MEYRLNKDVVNRSDFGLCYYFFSVTLYPAHGKVGRANLGLRHSAILESTLLGIAVRALGTIQDTTCAEAGSTVTCDSSDYYN